MATKNLSEQHNSQGINNAEGFNIGIAVAEWNSEITKALYEGAYNTLIKYGVKPENIIKKYVPGTFELTKAGQLFAEYTDVDAVILLGCVIQGETRHFDFICQGIAQGVTQLNLDYEQSFIFGVLTTDNQQQALDRAGGKHGNKGDEAAITALKMISLEDELFDFAIENLDDEYLEEDFED